ncbi:MAG: hypothetical protein AB1486_00230 [Planctomycetota bacterium]
MNSRWLCGLLTAGSVALVLSPWMLLGCGRGGGGGGGGGSVEYRQVVLEDLIFPDPSNQSSWGEKAPPDNASLVQRVVFVFSGPVDPEEADADSLQVRDLGNVPVPGEYVARGDEVTFYAALPTRSLVDLGGDQWDVGGAGFLPDSFYNITVPVGSKEAISTLVRVSPVLWERHDYQRVPATGSYVGRNYAAGSRSGLFSVRMRTTAEPAKFLTGYAQTPPRLRSASPSDSAADISPFLFTDPDQLFAEPVPFELVFDHPLDPSLDNVSDQAFHLVDLEDKNGLTRNVELGVDVKLWSNRHNEAIVRVRPNGILPFGDLLGLTYPLSLKGISGGQQELPGEEFATVFRVASAPAGGGRDIFSESFHTTDWEETSVEELGSGVIPARWDHKDSNFLQAAFSFGGSGELGRFAPVAADGSTRRIILDTNRQSFPLFDGSTPDALPGTVVLGGVFHFTDIVIPKGVTVQAVGQNPLVFTATGSVSIAGTIDVSGTRGVDDQSYDSAINPTPGGPGGPGGGRGGVGNPTIWWGSHVLANQVPPRRGERGWGPRDVAQLGGGGGEGTAYPDPDWPAFCGQPYCANDNVNACNDPSGGVPDLGCGSGLEFCRGAGGGGGTFLTSGESGRQGKGNRVSLEELDGSNYPVFAQNPSGNRSQGGAAGQLVFMDGDPLNDFIGALGEVEEITGGQGGGGGGNRHDSLMCTPYCFTTFPGFPGVLMDSKGGGGGGGGGAFMLKALGAVSIVGEARLIATGGNGGGGEQIGCTGWGGGGGGGSGGAVVIQSATSLTFTEDPETQLWAQVGVRGGTGSYAETNCYNNNGSCQGRARNNPGSGGDGGQGLIQMQVPAGQLPGLGLARFDPEESLIPPERTPSELTPVSVAQTKWINAGEVIRSAGKPLWQFTGTDPKTGHVLTDEAGFIRGPSKNDFKIDLLPVIDKQTGLILERGEEDYIPPGAYVKIEFQAADSIRPGSKEVDPATIVPGPGLWSSDIAIADGHQFIRYRVVFNIADTNQGYAVGPDRRQPVMRFVRLPLDF